MGLYENMIGEPVKDLALREPIVVAPNATVREAIQLMRQRQLGCVIVIDADRKPLGIFTENMLTQLVAKELPFADDPVERHMSANLPWVRLTDSVVSIVDALQTKNIRFLCAVDADGRVAALTGQKGLMEYIADHYPGQVMVQRVGVPASALQREGG